jgi:hypothetical protein
MNDPNDLKQKVDEIIRELDGERTRILIQGRALTPKEQRLVERIGEELPHLYQLADELAGDDDTPDYR